MSRPRGLSVRVKLTLSYAGFLMLAGALLLGAVWLFLLRYVPERALINPNTADFTHGVFPVRSRLLHVFAPRAAVVLAFLLVFGLVGGWFLAGRMLAPLARITAATRTAAAGSLSHRIELEGRGDEFHELADAFDAMLARLEAHVAEQRRFAANASHELRTPLAITQTLLDVARNDPGRNSELDERLRTVNARAIGLTEALLLLSRADQRSFTPEPVDLSLIAEEATETLLPMAGERGVTIQTSGDDTAPALGSPALLLQMTTNLVHNAIVHNLPDHGAVTVTTRVQPDGVVLVVENTGELLTAQLVSTLTEPFQRGTERIHTDQAGVGLGLAIVKSIVQAHCGTLTLTPRAAGGLCVTVLLPAASHTGTRRSSEQVCRTGRREQRDA